MINVVYGNDENALADSLSEFLFSSSKPFAKRLVVVPHFLVKDFLYSHFEKRLGIAAGVQIFPLNQAVLEIMGASSKRVPSFIEMTLAIEEKLRHLCKDESFPLHSYLKNNQRIASVSDALSHCFANYGLYGVQFLQQFLKGDGPQQTLWRHLFSNSDWTYPIEYLKLIPQGTCFEKIALFGFSYLAPVYLDFFSKLQATYYLLSPCSLFWGDLVSDKRRIFFKKRCQNEKEAQQLELLLEEGHPLLKNWGRLQQQMLKNLDAFLLNETEVYVERESHTLLKGLRSSLLHLEEPLLEVDRSIQLHSSPSILREVEALKNTIETLLHEHGFLPSDVVVACPDSAAYAPFIATVFAESGLPYRIEGTPVKHMSGALQGLFELLELPRRDYDLASMKQLFHNASLLEKRGFVEEEVTQLFQWFALAKIKRGMAGHAHSWESGIDRLLYGLARIPGETEILDLWPVPCVAKSDTDLFNRFLVFFSELKNDVAELKKQRSPEKWFRFFVEVAEKYFAISWERDAFFKELKQASKSCFTEGVWDFETIWRTVVHMANKPTGAFPSKTANSIHFVPLSLGMIKSSKIIFCLGMNEGVFPRLDLHSTLFEMHTDYMPLQLEEDRWLFLELLLKAQEYLILSYVKIHPEDGKEQGPSLLIEELIDYLSKYEIDLFRVDHPLLPFDPSYFMPESSIKNWSQVDFLAAKAQLEEKKVPPAFFSSSIEVQDKRPVELRKLQKLARHPLQFYFNETLKIFLKNEEDKEEEDFLISPLYRSLLCKEAVTSSATTLLDRSRAQGKLPRGVFHDIATRELQEEMDLLQLALVHFGIVPEEICSIDLEECHGVIGRLENVTPKGLLVQGEASVKNLVKIWPSYLIYRLLDPNHRFLLFTEKCLFLEIPLRDPKAALDSYLEYYTLARQRPSPLMPAWFKQLLEGKEPPLKDTKDPYLNYLKQRNSIPTSWECIPLGMEGVIHAL